MEEQISEHNPGVIDNLLSLDGIVIEESRSGQCLTLDGILMEDENTHEQELDGEEIQLDVEDHIDPTGQQDFHSDKIIFNQNVDINKEKNDTTDCIDDVVVSSKEPRNHDEFCTTETSSINMLSLGDEKQILSVTEPVDTTAQNNNFTVDLESTGNQIEKEENDKGQIEIEEQAVSLEDILRKSKNDQSDSSDSEFDFDLLQKSSEPQLHNKPDEILRKSKNDQSDSSDSEFDFDLPQKSSEPQLHNKPDANKPKTMISVSDIDFEFSMTAISQSSEEQSKSSKQEMDTSEKQTNRSEVDGKLDLENSSSNNLSTSMNLITGENTGKKPIPELIQNSSNVEGLQDKAQNSVDIVTSPKKKRAPDIPIDIAEGKADSTAQNDKIVSNEENRSKQENTMANGDVSIETENPVTFAPSAALRDAMNEWDNVQTIEAGFSDSKSGAPGSAKIVQAMPLLTFYELQEYFKTCDFSVVKSTIHTSIERHGFAALRNFLFGPPKLHRELLTEREQIFCVAASSLDNSNSIHLRSLQTVYRTLTGSRFDCGRYGSHWEEIGFQGNDPSTDLRGAGLLGLSNLIHFLVDPRRKPLAQDIYKLSLHPTQNFPFCVMGINMSRITLQALREDCLNKECNKRRDVFGVVNDFYTGLYLQLYQVWKSQGKTIADSGYVIKNIESSAKKSPHHVFKNLEDYLNKKKTIKSTSAVNLENMDVGRDNFLGVCETEAGQY